MKFAQSKLEKSSQKSRRNIWQIFRIDFENMSFFILNSLIVFFLLPLS